MKTLQSFARKPFVRRIALGGAGALILSTVAVRPAHSQFGFDIAAILAGLKEINSTLSSAVASPLKAINQVEQQEQQFQQNVLYPISAINSAKQMATGFTASFTSFRQLGTLNISSATLPNPQQLEQQMLSGNPNNIASIRQCLPECVCPTSGADGNATERCIPSRHGRCASTGRDQEGNRTRRVCGAGDGSRTETERPDRRRGPWNSTDP